MQTDKALVGERDAEFEKVVRQKYPKTAEMLLSSWNGEVYSANVQIWFQWWQASAARFSEVVAATQLALHEMDEQSSRRGHTSEEFFEAETRLRKALESVPEGE